MNKEKIASDKSVEELFKPLPRWKYALYFPVRLWYRIEDSWLNTIAFFQRGRRGYAKCDVWNFDYYLSKVITGGLKLLRKNHSGYPLGLTDEKWNSILDEMIEGFEARNNCESYEEFLSIEVDKKLNKSFELFAKYFQNLWD